MVEDYQVRTKDKDYESEDEGWDMNEYSPASAILQGNEASKIEEVEESKPDHPFETEEAETPWYNEEPYLAAFDIPLASVPTAKHSPEQFRDMVAKNCVIISVKDEDRNKWIRMRGVMLKGQTCLTVHHLFRTVLHKETVIVKIQCAPNRAGVTPNHEFTLSISSLFRDELMEIVAFQIPNLPPFRDITKFWMMNTDMYIHEGYELIREVS